MLFPEMQLICVDKLNRCISNLTVAGWRNNRW